MYIYSIITHNKSTIINRNYEGTTYIYLLLNLRKTLLKTIIFSLNSVTATQTTQITKTKHLNDQDHFGRI